MKKLNMNATAKNNTNTLQYDTHLLRRYITHFCIGIKNKVSANL